MNTCVLSDATTATPPQVLHQCFCDDGDRRSEQGAQSLYVALSRESVEVRCFSLDLHGSVGAKQLWPRVFHLGTEVTEPQHLAVSIGERPKAFLPRASEIRLSCLKV